MKKLLWMVRLPSYYVVGGVDQQRLEVKLLILHRYETPGSVNGIKMHSFHYVSKCFYHLILRWEKD